MQNQVAILTLFLGLVAGEQLVQLQVGPGVKLVRVVAGEETLATIAGPPWRSIVNFGKELTPRTLTAIAYGDGGAEVGRASQILNVPRPPAEVEILLRNDQYGTPAGVELRWLHIENIAMRKAELKLDDKPLRLDARNSAPLPPIDLARPHVLSAAVRFVSGFIARREIVFGGSWSATEPAELTPVLVHGDSNGGGSFESCFTADGQPVRTATIERSHGLVIIVRDPDAGEAIATLDPASVSRHNTPKNNILRYGGTVANDVIVEMMWPVTRSYGVQGQPTAELFAHTDDVTGEASGIPWLLTRLAGTPELRGQPKRWADAVAVAGVDAMTRARRRAVVLVLGKDASDRSRYDAAAVRRYMRTTGTPFFVWSLTGARPELAQTWGAVEDISTRDRLFAAVRNLNRELELQRVAWVQADRLTALRLEAVTGCAFTPLARQ
jgi:hypothetical protein